MGVLIIGNLLAFIASILMVYSGIVKEKKNILIIQTVQIGLFVISNLVLSGITGAIINAISMVRNIVCYKDNLKINGKVVITFLAAFFIFEI